MMFAVSFNTNRDLLFFFKWTSSIFSQFCRRAWICSDDLVKSLFYLCLLLYRPFRSRLALVLACERDCRMCFSPYFLMDLFMDSKPIIALFAATSWFSNCFGFY